MFDSILNFAGDLLQNGTALISFLVGGVTVAVSLTFKKNGKKVTGFKLVKNAIKKLFNKKEKN